MARVALTNYSLVAAGVEIETKLVGIGADGVAYDNTEGDHALLIKNGSASPTTITIDVPVLVDGDLTVANRTIAIAAGKYYVVKPLSTAIYNQSDAGGSGLTDAVLVDSSITDSTVEIMAFKP